MLKPIVVACVLFTSGVVAVNTNAETETIIFDSDVSLAGGMGFDGSRPDDVDAGQNLNTFFSVDSAGLSDLPQFDGPFDMLTSVTLSISGDLGGVTTVSGWWDEDDGAASNNSTANGLVVISAEVPIGENTVAVGPFTSIASNVSCSISPNDLGCSDDVDENKSITIGKTFAPGDAEMEAFLGGGDLGELEIKLFVVMSSLSSEPFDPLIYTEGTIDAYFSGEVSVDYEFSLAPVPLPAAAWMFGSGLLGVLGVKKIRRA